MGVSGAAVVILCDRDHRFRLDAKFVEGTEGLELERVLTFCGIPMRKAATGEEVGTRGCRFLSDGYDVDYVAGKVESRAGVLIVDPDLFKGGPFEKIVDACDFALLDARIAGVGGA